MADKPKCNVSFAFNWAQNEKAPHVNLDVQLSPHFHHEDGRSELHLPLHLVPELWFSPVVDPTVQQGEAGQTTAAYLEESDREIRGRVVHQRQGPARQTLLCRIL